MKIRLLTAALRDLESGQAFYERQGDNLGEYYLDSLFADIDSLVIYAGIHRKVFGFYRLLAKRFPWAIYYRLTAGGDVIVYRVLDCRQDPGKVDDALRRPSR